jgi:hypothetical protein
MNSHPTTCPPESFRRSQIAFWLVLLAALVGAAAYFRMFTGFLPYDDEGALMLSVKEYLGGRKLYQDVFSVYGPVYYLYNLLARTLTSTPVTHDVTRISSLFPWVACSLLSGGIVLRLTRSLVLAAAILTLTSMAVTFFNSEPGHPQELTLLLLVALATCPVWLDLVRRRSTLMIAMGLLAGALTLIKVNIGLFMLASLALALFAHFPPAPFWRYLGCIIGGGCILIPPGLMRTHLGDAAWARTYCLLAAISIAAAGVCLLKIRRRSLISLRDLIVAAAGCALMIAGVMAIMVAQGVSLSAILDSVVLLPTRVHAQSRNWFHAPRFSAAWIGWALLGLGFSIHTAWSRPAPKSPQFRRLLLLKAVFTAAASAAILLHADLFPMVAPFAWLVLLKSSPADQDTQEFPRTVLCSVTVMQTLYGYPVYGSQGRFIQILMLVVIAVFAGDSLIWLTGFGTRPAWFVRRRPRIATLSLVAIAAINLGIAVNRYRIYSGLPSLGLPGAQRIHLDPPQRAELVSITTNVARSCDVFEGLPGLPSLNFWTEKEPATAINWDGWTLFFTPEQQNRIVQALSAHSQACIVYNPALAALWDPGGHQDFESMPLVQYIRREFKPVVASGEYRLLIRKERVWTTSNPQ